MSDIILGAGDRRQWTKQTRHAAFGEPAFYWGDKTNKQSIYRAQSCDAKGKSKAGRDQEREGGEVSQFNIGLWRGPYWEVAFEKKTQGTEGAGHVGAWGKHLGRETKAKVGFSPEYSRPQIPLCVPHVPPSYTSRCDPNDPQASISLPSLLLEGISSSLNFSSTSVGSLLTFFHPIKEQSCLRWWHSSFSTFSTMHLF